MVTLKIPCPHESGQVADFHQEVSDYHPLNKDEIKELLDMAKKIRNGVELAEIQVRLSQGVQGMTCPRPYDEGQVSLNDSEMNSLFMDRYKEGGTPELVDLIDKLLNWQ